MDLAVQDLAHLRISHGVAVPLVFMTPFDHQEEILHGMKAHSHQPINVTTVLQSKYPYLLEDTLLPVPSKEDDSNEKWYTPGTGDVFASLVRSGTLDRLLAEGKEYLFVSSLCNPGAA